jgi:hypothetical protein
MAKWVHADVLDDGLNVIVANCDKMALIGNYAAGDDYGTVDATILASVAIAPGDILVTDSGLNRVLTTPTGKFDPAAAASGGGVTNHIAFLDTVNERVLWVTNEPSGNVITAGNQVNFAVQTLTSFQPI